MTGTGPLGRRYMLDLADQGGAVRARVRQSGDAGLARVGLGRPAVEAPRLAGLLFSLCPRAQTTAALRAVEQAAGVALAPGQAAAREAVLLGEGVAASVWRMAVTWPTLTGGTMDAAPVRAAREAADALLADLFDGPWAEPGGCLLKSVTAAPRSAVDALFEALRRSEAGIGPLLDQANAIRLHRGDTCCLLQDGIFAEDLCPDCSGHEETPRALLAPGEMTDSLGPWFDAQLSHGFTLLARLRRTLDRVAPDAPTPFPDGATGRGMGVAMTARGRLRHGLVLEDGLIRGWTTAAPTDWNFAPNGPVAATARRLAPGPGLRARAQWLVAAFDPCAPCDVALQAALTPRSGEEAVHA
ncbi:MAG: hypothetical protein ACFB6R_10100 [Alphaproteobacteria bacterium]